ncbi:MAG: hypothetical protein ACREPE_16250 [Lysobacter sp.]
MDRQRRLILQLGASAGVGAAAMTLHAASSISPGAASEPAGDADAATAAAGAAPGRDGRHDFDFYFGRWHVHNRRLRQRLVGSTEWDEFEAVDECRPVLDGLGSVDHYRTEWNGGVTGFALRLYRPATRDWHVYWASARDGVLEVPLVGRFHDGVGRFEGTELHEGRMLPSRAIWRDISADSVHWEQALSADDGKTWETNWIAHFTRTGDAP